ncbi:MAG TPA: D-alanyl-D-alanine carboxypeptidase family protein, partial [Candidatus Methylomirabilis sp.]
MASELVKASGGPRAWWRRHARPCIALAAVLAVLGGAAAAPAARGTRHREGAGKPAAAGSALSPESLEAPAAVLMDAETGAMLFAKEPHRVSPPASMTKMMVALIVLEQVQAGKRKLDEPVRTSARAEAMGGSQVYLQRDEVFSIEEMLKAVMIGSANDAAVAVAEHVAGSVEGFVDLMNARAEALGMKDTRFATPHGLPPGSGQEGDVSSPYDMAILSRAVAGHPQALQWAGTREAPFREGKFILRNPNHLLGAFAGLDGLKTGHYKEAGYNLAATAARDGLRLVAVVMGEPNGKTRFAEAARLLNWG